METTFTAAQRIVLAAYFAARTTEDREDAIEACVEVGLAPEDADRYDAELHGEAVR